MKHKNLHKVGKSDNFTSDCSHPMLTITMLFGCQIVTHYLSITQSASYVHTKFLNRFSIKTQKLWHKSGFLLKLPHTYYCIWIIYKMFWYFGTGLHPRGTNLFDIRYQIPSCQIPESPHYGWSDSLICWKQNTTSLMVAKRGDLISTHLVPEKG